MASQSTMLVVLFLVLPALVLVEHCAFSLCWPQGKGEKASQPGPAASVPLLVRLAQPPVGLAVQDLSLWSAAQPMTMGAAPHTLATLPRR